MDYAKGVKGEIDQRPKRFYTDVAVAGGDGWVITLDGRAMKTPAGKRMMLPKQALAELLADEWRAQGERIDFASMYNTRRTYGILDRPADVRQQLVDQAARYAGTDLVCYLADKPVELRERQQAAWDPLRAWAGAAHGVMLKPVTGLMPEPQPPEAISAMRAHAEGLDDFRLDGLAGAIALLGSAVLGLAVERGRITASTGYEISRIDEAFQAEKWGEDHEAVQRIERQRVEARAFDLWFGALAQA